MTASDTSRPPVPRRWEWVPSVVPRRGGYRGRRWECRGTPPRRRHFCRALPSVGMPGSRIRRRGWGATPIAAVQPLGSGVGVHVHGRISLFAGNYLLLPQTNACVHVSGAITGSVRPGPRRVCLAGIVPLCHPLAVFFERDSCLTSRFTVRRL